MYHTPQGGLSLRAQALKSQQARRASRRRKIYVADGFVVHDAPGGRRVTKPVKREVTVYRGLYTGHMIKELSRRNGSGRSLRLIAIKQMKAMLRAEGDTRPMWMRTTEIL
jgi:hypothetical protein